MICYQINRHSRSPNRRYRISTQMKADKIPSALHRCSSVLKNTFLFLSHSSQIRAKAAAGSSKRNRAPNHQNPTRFQSTFGVTIVLIASIGPFRTHTGQTNRNSSPQLFLTFHLLRRTTAPANPFLSPIMPCCKAYSGNSKVFSTQSQLSRIQTRQQVIAINLGVGWSTAAAPSQSQLWPLSKHLYHKSEWIVNKSTLYLAAARQAPATVFGIRETSKSRKIRFPAVLKFPKSPAGTHKQFQTHFPEDTCGSLSRRCDRLFLTRNIQSNNEFDYQRSSAVIFSIHLRLKSYSDTKRTNLFFPTCKTLPHKSAGDSKVSINIRTRSPSNFTPRPASTPRITAAFTKPLALRI